MSKHKHNLPTVSVGVPAYNEQQNIEKLIRSIYSLSTSNFVLESVIIVSDGSTDRTIEIVKTLQDSHSNLILSASSERGGKAQALNKIYKLSTADYLLTIDADVLPAKTDFLEVLVEHFNTHPNALVVGPRHVPTKTKTFWGRCAEISYLSFEQAFLQFKNGNNMYGIMSAYLIRKNHYSTLQFPKGVMADQCYLFSSAVSKHPQGFQLAMDAQVWFAPVDSLQDWRLLGLRSVGGDREDVQKYFGPEIVEENQLPKQLYYQSLLQWLIKDPVHTVGSILLNIFIRKFPLKKNLPKNGLWETSASSKTVQVNA